MAEQHECAHHGLTEYTEPDKNGDSFCKKCCEEVPECNPPHLNMTIDGPPEDGVFYWDELCVCGHSGTAHCNDDQCCVWDIKYHEYGGACMEPDCDCATFRPRSMHPCAGGLRMVEKSDDTSWLDEIVTRHLNANIDNLAKGREHIINKRSRELLIAISGNVVLDVLAELLEEKDG